MGNDEENIGTLIIKLKDGNEGIWQYAAIILAKKGKKALPHLIAAIENDSYDSEKWNTVGLELLFQKKYEIAKKLFYELLKKENGDTKGRNLNNLGLSFLGLRKPKEALEVFLEAFDFDVNRSSIQAAKEMPAWKNIVFTLSISRMKKSPPVRIGGNFQPEVISPFAKIVLEEVIGGGFIAASLISLIMLIERYYPDANILGIEVDIILPVVMLLGGTSFLYFYLRRKYR